MWPSVGSGRTAFEQSAATLPGVSAPSSVVRSMQRIASSSAKSLASRLIERFARSAARLPTPTQPAGADGLPVPPARLIMRVAGTPDVTWFLESGRLAAESIHDALERAETPLDTVASILDFGCGCGRVIRNWARLD